LAAEIIPGDLDDLITKLDRSPEKRRRKAEIEAELMREYGEELHE
jgi:hypothetical protein